MSCKGMLQKEIIYVSEVGIIVLHFLTQITLRYTLITCICHINSVKKLNLLSNVTIRGFGFRNICSFQDRRIMKI